MIMFSSWFEKKPTFFNLRLLPFLEGHSPRLWNHVNHTFIGTRSWELLDIVPGIDVVVVVADEGVDADRFSPDVSRDIGNEPFLSS